MKKMALVVLLAMGIGVTNSFAQNKTVKRTANKTVSVKSSNKPGGIRLTKTQPRKTDMVSAKKQSANR